MKEYVRFLKSQDKSPGNGRGRTDVWTVQNLEAGFEKFYEKNGHYPSAPEIDAFEYLPSARQIQRTFGGLSKLRKTLSLEHDVADHNSGEIRSKIAGMAMARADAYEEAYYLYLTKFIPEVYVHEHKVLRYKGQKTDTDFFVYDPNLKDGVAIDLFYAVDIVNLLKQISIKIPKYRPIPVPVYFVSMNEELSQDLIEFRISSKKTEIPNNITVCSVAHFNSKILPSIISKFV